MSSKIKLSIGMPVYNCEKSIGKAIDSLLNQTFVDFELIISDNASTDSTAEICKEYAKKDGRIRYIRQSRNMGMIWNFLFVLQEANCKYFQWAAADDLWHPEFLKKNIDILESNQNVVGSIGDVIFYERITDELAVLIKNSKNVAMKYQHVIPAYGLYAKRVQLYLRLRQASAIYGLYRTEKLRNCVGHGEHISWDFAVVLGVLKYGDFHVINDVLMYRYSGGISGTKSNLEYMIEHNFPISVILFPNGLFTFWCARQFGLRIFIKNFVWIARFLLQGESQLLLDVISLFKKKYKNTQQIP